MGVQLGLVRYYRIDWGSHNGTHIDYRCHIGYGSAFALRALCRVHQLCYSTQRSCIESIANDLRTRTEVEVSTHAFDALDMEKHEAFYQGLPERLDGVICFVGYSVMRQRVSKRL